MPTTLLDKALERKGRARLLDYGPEDADLAIAWAEGRVNTSQVAEAWGIARGAIYSSLALSLRAAIALGKLKNPQK